MKNFSNFQRQPIYYYHTTCCAMLIASMKDYHSFKEIRDSLNNIKENSDSQYWDVNDRSGGERNVMCIISPGEKNLERNLIKLGFKQLAKNMPRRLGYPPGTLKMYLLSWPR